MSGKLKVGVFIGVTFSLTLLFHIILQLYGGQSNPSAYSLLGIPMVFPLVSVMVVQRGVIKDKLKRYFGMPLQLNRWYFYAALIPVCMAMFTNVAGIVITKSKLPVLVETLELFFINLLFGLSLAALSALLEQIAWTGFLYDELKYLGQVKSFTLISVIWAVWHSPVTIWYKYSDAPLMGLLTSYVLLFVLSFIMCYVRYKADSVIAAAITHGMLNTMVLSPSSNLFTMGVFGTDWLRIVAAVIVLVLLISMSHTLGKHKQKKPAESES